MRHDPIVPDDRLTEVPRTWVGAGGYIFFFEARFIAWFLYFGIAPVLEILGFIIWGFNLGVMIVAAIVALIISWTLMLFVDYEKPLRAIVRHFAVTIARSARRPRPARGASIVVSLRVKARQERPTKVPLAGQLQRLSTLWSGGNG